ncbi:MAG TPA: maleylpyruvate isomerase family mycothiol-dependent enzyme [Acidimicrobiales bacterium]|nr:maleylpyruvate isomerase family mycothiol-dependent enzyme [Acidimicrobiales bacterium]
MTQGAIEALRADRSVLLDLCSEMSDQDFKAESGCEGWSAQDVVAHMGALFWLVVDPSVLPDASALPTERAQDVYVEERRSWASAKVVEDYESVSSEAIERLAGLEGQDFELPLGDLGTYPATLLPNAYSFDHYTHIREDLFLPRGPLTGDRPPSDEKRLTPAIEWIAAALPQQNAAQISKLGGALDIVVTGPSARTIRVGEGETVARIESESPSFIRWVTGRTSWDDAGVRTTGDESALTAARSLHVF